jgi:hypothetical protein
VREFWSLLRQALLLASLYVDFDLVHLKTDEKRGRRKGHPGLDFSTEPPITEALALLLYFAFARCARSTARKLCEGGSSGRSASLISCFTRALVRPSRAVGAH